MYNYLLMIIYVIEINIEYCIIKNDESKYFTVNLINLLKMFTVKINQNLNEIYRKKCYKIIEK